MSKAKPNRQSARKRQRSLSAGPNVTHGKFIPVMSAKSCSKTTVPASIARLAMQRIETAAVSPVQLLAPNTKKTTLEKTTTKKTPTTKQGSKSAAKLSKAVEKNVATTRSKLAKKTSRAKQALPIKKAVTSKKAQSTNPSTKSVAKKIGRKK
jgi:hypothetical protein